MVSIRGFAPALLLAGAVLAGCRYDTRPISGGPDEVVNYPDISLSEDTLQHALGFQQPIVSRTSGNLLQVTLPVRGKSNEQLQVEYKVIWFDASGQPLRPDVGWVPLRLEPRQPTSITVNSTSSDAVRFNIQWRWTRR